MKPHLRMRWGWWTCCDPRAQWVYTIGATPQAAFEAWVRTGK